MADAIFTHFHSRRPTFIGGKRTQSSISGRSRLFSFTEIHDTEFSLLTFATNVFGHSMHLYMYVCLAFVIDFFYCVRWGFHYFSSCMFSLPISSNIFHWIFHHFIFSLRKPVHIRSFSSFFSLQIYICCRKKHIVNTYYTYSNQNLNKHMFVSIIFSNFLQTNNTH
jgi:hypothetical protein